ncbi:MAG: sensor hybrid histidine kinase [Verrucomicrobia bacterium]|nr:sensor hybrid histidine kinase [Verrucomicrobiota bacterium]
MLAGILAGYFGYAQKREQMLGAMIDSTSHSAVAFQFADVSALAGTREDLPGPAYAAVTSRLKRFQEADPKVRGIRLFRYFPNDKRAIVLAESVPAEIAVRSLPGDAYAAAKLSPNLQASLRTGETVVDGPRESEQATVVTGYALISPKTATGARNFLGIDLQVEHWTSDLLAAASWPALFTWVVLGVPFAGFIVIRREREQGEAIRNLSEAAEQSKAAIMIIDLKGDIDYVNRGLCDQIGCLPIDLVGHNWREFQVTEAPGSDIVDLVAAMKEGRPWTGEWFNRRKDGTIYPVRGAFTPVRRNNGVLTGCIATFDDITQLKETETMLREAKERAESGETAKSQFLATMSHEVRTPLNGIIGFTSLLLDTPLTPEQREFVQTIQLSSEALIQLTGDILDYARIESGKLKLDPQPCAPRECVEDALDLVATKATANGIELLHWVDDSVPALIHADGNRLRQVLINLLGNAVKFTTAGEIEVRVEADRGAVIDAQNPAKLTFSVRDTGIGIAPEQHEKLFKPFGQLDQALTRRHGGTGLGLAICKNIVELMGGQFSVQSELGRGSTFSFTIGIEPHPTISYRKPLAPLPQLNLAIAAPDGSGRTELMRLGKRFGANLAETVPSQLALTPGWDVALLDLSAHKITELISESQPSPDLPPERVFGLVPVSTPSVVRAALRNHFRLLINKPVHQDALYAVLATVADSPVVAQPKRDSSGLSVLLVEDDPVNRLMMQKQLSILGCRWTKAENGRIAVQEMARKAFDVVLMDLYMPEMDGVTAIAQIRGGRAGELGKDVWIAALTADARSDQKERTLEMGANDYLVKPVSLPELRVALEKFAIARRRRG